VPRVKLRSRRPETMWQTVAGQVGVDFLLLMHAFEHDPPTMGFLTQLYPIRG